MKPTISIITVVRNREKSIGCAIKSLNIQDYKHVEHIIIDGASTDGTLKIINSLRSPNSVLISEPDAGIYDALNKGISISSGEIIGILHSDDFYVDSKVLTTVMNEFENSNLDAVYGDVNFVNNNGSVIRHYSSHRFCKEKIGRGEMMAHTALFLKKNIFNENGLYSTSYKIAGDFEFIARIFTKREIKYAYLNKTIVNMKIGGVSNKSLINRLKINLEIKRACQENGISTNCIKLSSRYFYKLIEFAFLKNIKLKFWQRKKLRT